MNGGEARPFDFAALDGVAFAAERGKFDIAALPRLTADDLGPYIELVQLAEAGRLPMPAMANSWLAPGRLDALAHALAQGRAQWHAREGWHAGFMKAGAAQDETAWTAFGLAAQRAAVAAGFAGPIAAQFAGALGELYSNIHEHSGAAATGLLAYKARPGRFEFAAADRGVGILDSLRSGGAHSALRDHGEALRLALTDGVSRYGDDIGCGHGFRPLFIGLANLNGALRFRAGDHALLMDGRSPALMTARAAQKTWIEGFLVSVVCDAPGRGTA